jgi:hypothetical protein
MEMATEMNEPNIKLYTFTYTFACEEGHDPAEVLNQEIYEIVVKSEDKLSDYGNIEEQIVTVNRK